MFFSPKDTYFPAGNTTSLFCGVLSYPVPLHIHFPLVENLPHREDISILPSHTP